VLQASNNFLFKCHNNRLLTESVKHHAPHRTARGAQALRQFWPDFFSEAERRRLIESRIKGSAVPGGGKAGPRPCITRFHGRAPPGHVIGIEKLHVSVSASDSVQLETTTG